MPTKWKMMKCSQNQMRSIMKERSFWRFAFYNYFYVDLWPIFCTYWLNQVGPNIFWTWDHKVPSPAPLLPLHFIILLPLFGLLPFCRHCGSCWVYTGPSRVLWSHSYRGLVTFDVSGCWWCQSSCVVSPNSNTRACVQAMEGLIGGCKPPVTGFYQNPCSCLYL